MKNIVLIGFMGTGKSAIGRKLAACLDREFVDTDAEIENITGKTIAKLFACDGEIRFRSEETLMVKKLAKQENLVIATGGGMVLNPENVRLLSQNGVFICLTCKSEVICQRIKNKKSRPLLLKGNLFTRVNELLNERSEAYSIAEYTIDTGSCAIEEAIEQIVNYLQEKDYL